LEIEAKFGIPDEQRFQQLLQATTLAGFVLGEAAVAELHDRYLDTAEGAMLAAGYACRLRRLGKGSDEASSGTPPDGRVLATLKALGRATGAIHRRPEYEVALAEPSPPVDWPPSPARDLALGLAGGEPLIILFDIEQTRHSRPLLDGDRVVAELSLDRVRLSRGDVLADTYLELEAELEPEGCERDLEKLVRELEDGWGLEPDRQSKFERALATFGLEATERRTADSGTEDHLSRRERAIVEQLLDKREVIARRARLLLAWDEGLSRNEMLERASLSARRARYWLSAFRELRLGIFPQAALDAAANTLFVPHLPTGQEPVAAAEGPVPEAPATSPPPLPSGIELLNKPGIQADDPMSEAGRKTFRFHYRRMLHHEPGTRLGEDIEALHDMRVATRRMRAAFRIFGDYFDPEVTAPYLKGLKRTGRTLGAVRDLDVFHQKVQAYVNSLPPSQGAGLQGLLSVLDSQREAARQRMIAYLDSSRYRRFAAGFGEFVETEGMGSLPATIAGGEPQPYRVRHVAPMTIYERLAAVRAYDEWVNMPNPPLARLHALRIACKGLRYTLEFFGEVLGPTTKAVVKQVVTLQDHLGDLHDAVMASGILRDFLVWGTWGHDDAQPRPPVLETPVIAPGVAAYLATKQGELQDLWDSFPQVWQQLKGSEFSRMVAEAVAVL
jgi:CHAD domain-containing protein